MSRYFLAPTFFLLSSPCRSSAARSRRLSTPRELFEALGADSPPDIPAAVLDRKSKVSSGKLTLRLTPRPSPLTPHPRPSPSPLAPRPRPRPRPHPHPHPHQGGLRQFGSNSSHEARDRARRLGCGARNVRRAHHRRQGPAASRHDAARARGQQHHPRAQGVRGRDGVGWPCHVERVRWSWVCDVMTHLMNGTSFVHADTTSHSTPRGPLAGELSTCASDSPGAPGPRRSDIRERRTQHTLLSKQVK